METTAIGGGIVGMSAVWTLRANDHCGVTVDQYIERNDLAIARRAKAYLKSLNVFRDL